MRISNRSEIIEYVKQNDPEYRVEDNVIFFPKLFIINTVIQWCYNHLPPNKIQPTSMAFSLMSIHCFLEGKIPFSWDEDGNLVFSWPPWLVVCGVAFFRTIYYDAKCLCGDYILGD